MTTYSIRELKAKAGQILDSLAEGEEVIITRRGKPCARLMAVAAAAERPPLTPLQEKYAHLPELSLEEIQQYRAEMNDAWKAKFDDIPGDDAK